MNLCQDFIRHQQDRVDQNSKISEGTKALPISNSCADADQS